MASKFHELTETDLKDQLEAAKSELREIRFQFGVTRTVQDPGRVSTLKKNVARIYTVLRERELGLAVQKEPTKDKSDKKKKKK